MLEEPSTLLKDAYGSAVFSGGRLASRFPGFPICTADGCVRFLTNTGERSARSAPRRNDARLDTGVRHHKSTPQHKPNSIMTSEENPTRQFDDVSAYWVRQEGASEDYYACDGRGIAWGRRGTFALIVCNSLSKAVIGLNLV